MKGIYFQELRLKNALTRATTPLNSFLFRFFPSTANSFWKPLLFNPRGRRHYEFSKIKPDGEVILQTQLGEVLVHTFENSGPAIVLCHGWADTSKRFENLILELIGAKYSVYCIDQIGHGRSAGDEAHVFGFIESIEKLLGYLDENDNPIAGFISHSMGGLSIINQRSEVLKNKKIIFIGLPVQFFEYLFIRFKKLGLSKEVTEKILQELSTTYNRPWQTVDLKRNKNKLSTNTLVIHDIKDSYASFKNSQKYFKGTPVNYQITHGLGHHKIVKDPQVIKSILAFLNSK